MAETTQRQRELAKIHIGAKQLGIVEDAYRDMLWTVARVRSAKDLDQNGRQAVLEHLKARGFKTKRKGRSVPSNDRAGLVAKIQKQLGDRPEAYADGMARKMFDVDRYEWCTPHQLWKIVAALNYDAKRKQ